ncbi:hypothetical protein A3I18_01225 [Candidatus Campbellbacteria bacterium RIFCSPLOWO2_02_FULL_35_11]|uniref:Uncharacterized protein n=2 Tax=Candidatus Campbelliibacteriota TaxID=1752727 RepID=A0A1F5EP59_9BACT|nr:MAG: hypothetical protein A3E89_01650 [Candidatus Campbellbacteria bacterium RIFCSPHIGHO2_12_FULL_35_10]OGD70844.1 MAG: hypothetical protein A3I18_01225 [Candidatus Campbellbacteria bacterium RIFCSPLOWO2_02_FULL_35_11]
MSGKRLPKKNKRKKKGNNEMKVWAFSGWNVPEREFIPEAAPRVECFWQMKLIFKSLKLIFTT